MNAPAQPLVVVALGGNAISPPRGDPGFGRERQLIGRAAMEIAGIATSGARLLIVHGNGPQVGRLLAADQADRGDLDIRVAQTQGELGYLIAEALSEHLGIDNVVALVTRVLVDPLDPAFAQPSKPIGAVLDAPPGGVPSVRMPDGTGWRRVVASPRPSAVIEQAAVAALLATHHVIAGGGGGVALGPTPGARRPQAAVIDKDWVAALLAIALQATHLLFVTDVAHACDRFGQADQQVIATMTVTEARCRLEQAVFAPGSMAPKIESAAEFVAATGRRATIAELGALMAALRGTTGTTILP